MGLLVRVPQLGFARPAWAALVALALAGGCASRSDSPDPAETAASTAPPKVSGTTAVKLPSELDRDRDAIVHALNRLGFGPRPGEVESIRRRGLERWIEDQLHPQRLDDAELQRELTRYETLTMTPEQVLSAFPPSQLIERTLRYLRRDLALDEKRIREIYPNRDAPNPSRLLAELRHAKLVRAIESERQLQEVLTDFWFNHFNVYANKGASRWWVSSYERDAIRPHALGNFRDLLGATARHPAMLFYLDNWLSAAPGSRAYGLAIRVPSADRAEMLDLPAGGLPVKFLQQRGVDTADLERSIATRLERRRQAEAGRRPQPERDDPNRRRGLNENYARELLELHTLGVDGGYGQADIVEVARAFTGWTLALRDAGQGFVFLDEWHDRGPKTVLGTRLTAKGMAEGEQVLDLLATHPQTARFVSTKLARRFVSDRPPQALVDRMAEAFLESGGEIRAVLVAMIEAPEFWSEPVRRAKVKSPFEYVVSMVRATEAQVNPLPPMENFGTTPVAMMDGLTAGMTDEMRGASAGGMDLDADPNAEALPAPALNRFVRNLGQPLYLAGPPTGFGDEASTWISAGSMLDRFRVAVRLASNRLSGVEVPIPDEYARLDSDEELLRQLAVRTLGRELERKQRDVLLTQLRRAPEKNRARMALALLLASPEFQRR